MKDASDQLGPVQTAMISSTDRPIGVFDSGIGGLAVLQELKRELPQERFIYLADSGFAPYGDKSNHAIMERAQRCAQFLLEQGAKALVIACNTATAAAVAELRERYAVPIIGMEPGIKPAVQRTRTGKIGVLVTRGTALSEKYARLMSAYANVAQIVTQPCPGLVERIEAGALEQPQTYELLADYVSPLLAQGVDTLVLGCTHYCWLRPQIQRLNSHVQIIDTSRPVALQLRRRLAESSQLATSERLETMALWTSGEQDRLYRLLESLHWPVRSMRDGPPRQGEFYFIGLLEGVS
jgi:glutamate racemase